MQASNDKKAHTRQVGIDDVAVGMFVEDIITDQGGLFVEQNMKIGSQQQIDSLKKRGIKAVRINTQKGMGAKSDAGADATDEGKEAEVDYDTELAKAVIIHKEGIIKVGEVLKTIRNGRNFSLVMVRTVAESIVESIIRNRDALVSLCQIKDNDNYTYTHSLNVAILIVAVANSLKYPVDRLVEIGMGGLLHDIGKMRVPESILNKPGRLTDTEFAMMKRHPEFGVESILDQRGIADITKKVVLQHHERYNGKGYPFGIKGERIHEVGLISAIADVYDALTSERVYKAALTPQKALAMIFRNSDKEYSNKIVEQFTRLMGIYPVGSFVKLTTGEMGVVVRMDREALLAPSVLILFDRMGNRLKEPHTMESLNRQAGKQGEVHKIEMSLNPAAFNIDVGEYIVNNSLILNK